MANNATNPKKTSGSRFATNPLIKQHIPQIKITYIHSPQFHVSLTESRNTCFAC